MPLSKIRGCLKVFSSRSPYFFFKLTVNIYSRPSGPALVHANVRVIHASKSCSCYLQWSWIWHVVSVAQIRSSHVVMSLLIKPTQLIDWFFTVAQVRKKVLLKGAYWLVLYIVQADWLITEFVVQICKKNTGLSVSSTWLTKRKFTAKAGAGQSFITWWGLYASNRGL